NFAIVTLDDRSDRMEATVYGDVYQAHRELIRKDSIVVLEGVVSVDEYNGNGQLQMRVRRILDLAQARLQYSRVLDLTLNRGRLSVESLPTLRRLLDPLRKPVPETAAGTAPGGCDIVIHVELDDLQGSLHLGEDWRVPPED